LRACIGGVLRGGIINAELVHLLATLRHTDRVVVADSGLPVHAAGPPTVDLAVVYGVPPFDVVFRAVIELIVVEAAVVAEEIAQANPACLQLIEDTLPVRPGRIPHETFKAEVAGTRAVVRTGEATPYANVILTCGVPFGAHSRASKDPPRSPDPGASPRASLR
jgi:D-ribose pyranase